MGAGTRTRFDARRDELEDAMVSRIDGADVVAPDRMRVDAYIESVHAQIATHLRVGPGRLASEAQWIERQLVSGPPKVPGQRRRPAQKPNDETRPLTRSERCEGYETALRKYAAGDKHSAGEGSRGAELRRLIADALSCPLTLQDLSMLGAAVHLAAQRWGVAA